MHVVLDGSESHIIPRHGTISLAADMAVFASYIKSRKQAALCSVNHPKNSLLGIYPGYLALPTSLCNMRAQSVNMWHAERPIDPEDKLDRKIQGNKTMLLAGQNIKSLFKNTSDQSIRPADARAPDLPNVLRQTAQADKAADFPRASEDSDHTTAAASSAPLAVTALVLSTAGTWQAKAADTSIELVSAILEPRHVAQEGFVPIAHS